MQMKRILVIDESEVVRETLALILGHEFIVFHRSLGTSPLSLAEPEEQPDLVILGVTASLAAQPATLLNFAARVPFAILFLVDSKSTAKLIGDRTQVGCLTRPFNPYELRDKVARLLAYREALPNTQAPARDEKSQRFDQYLDFPYLSRTAATLARRFAATRLSVLIAGEIGCGQDRVARAMGALRGGAIRRITVNENQVTIDPTLEVASGFLADPNLPGGAMTLLIENVDKLSTVQQSSLLNFLEEKGGFGRCETLATAQGDLLEQVYSGHFLERLYYKLATLKLNLAPLRDRRDEIPVIALWFAQFYAEELDLGKASLSPQANQRLSNYLWFGNLGEMEAVIARTLALAGKAHIDASDLVFDSYGRGTGLDSAHLSAAARVEWPAGDAQAQHRLSNDLGIEKRDQLGEWGNGSARPVDLTVLIHELAHELKNPMVTIKTFAQLLGDRYHDENFRARFQEVVASDIERMDELLEVLIQFSEFSQPQATNVALAERLCSVLAEIGSDCAKRQTAIRWMENGHSREIRTDEDQLAYSLKNVLLGILSQTKIGSEIEIAIDSRGTLVISYAPDAARMTSVTHYLGRPSGLLEENLPLRMLLAKVLVERNGGKMFMEHSRAEKEILRMEFPTA